MAIEKEADVTLECMKKCIHLQVHQSLVSAEKERFSLIFPENKDVGQKKESG